MLQLVMNREITGAECKILGIKKKDIRITRPVPPNFWTQPRNPPSSICLFPCKRWGINYERPAKRDFLHEIDGDLPAGFMMFLLKSSIDIVYAIDTQTLLQILDKWVETDKRIRDLNTAKEQLWHVLEMTINYRKLTGKYSHIKPSSIAIPVVKGIVDYLDAILPADLEERFATATKELVDTGDSLFMDFHNSVTWLVAPKIVQV